MAPVIAEHDVRWLEVFVDDVVTVEDLEALIQGRYDLLLQLGEREPPPLQASRRVVRDDLKREALPGPRLKQPRHIRRVDAAQCRDNGILDGRRPAVDLGDVLFATIGADVERGLARGRRQQAFHSVLIEQHGACRYPLRRAVQEVVDLGEIRLPRFLRRQIDLGLCAAQAGIQRSRRRARAHGVRIDLCVDLRIDLCRRCAFLYHLSPRLSICSGCPEADELGNS